MTVWTEDHEHHELLDCPMCGTRPMMHIESNNFYSLVSIQCGACGLKTREEKSLSESPDSPDAEIVLQAWNDRV